MELPESECRRVVKPDDARRERECRPSKVGLRFDAGRRSEAYGSRLQGLLQLGTVPLRNTLPVVRPVRDALLIYPAVQLLVGAGRRRVSGGRRARRWSCCGWCGRRGRRRLRDGRSPYPPEGSRHAVALETVAPADVAQLRLGWRGRVHLRLICGSGHIDRIRIDRVGVRRGVVRSREHRAPDRPAKERAPPAAAAMEVAFVLTGSVLTRTTCVTSSGDAGDALSSSPASLTAEVNYGS